MSKLTKLIVVVKKFSKPEKSKDETIKNIRSLFKIKIKRIKTTKDKINSDIRNLTNRNLANR